MASPSVRLCLVLHDHQPVGNFEGVFEAAYQDSYAPFLDVFESYADLRLSLHTSGSLLEWLDRRHPEYLDRLTALVHAGRVEILGGAFFEPILTMLPPRDRIGQIVHFTRWLEPRFGAKIRGAWIPERVWEASLTSDLAAAAIEYVVLDDYHFRSAGLTSEQLDGYYLTEDSGHLLKVFPGSEQLRYLIPFGTPEQTIELLRKMGERSPGAIATFGDDGEKFGTWPETKDHVYRDGWLRSFFDALIANRDWLETVTLSQAVDQVPPVGKIYLPDASYREMSEWVLPVDRQLAYHSAIDQLRREERFEPIRPFVQGGFWRNYKVRYGEANELYARMMYVSDLLRHAELAPADLGALDQARHHLYRGQCNCAYWHGAFGGLYLPHLRNAIYRELIEAENQLERVAGRTGSWVEVAVEDFNLDARSEARLASDQVVCWLEPAAGGRMYELDVRSIGLNLGATLCRRPEAYHEKVRAGEQHDEASATSIHDRVVFKQANLEQLLIYDRRMRKSLIDHFWAPGVTLDQVARQQDIELADFADGAYQARIRRDPDRAQVQMIRRGKCGEHSIQITKGVTLVSGGDELEIAYLIEGLPREPLWFGVEFNFAGLPGGLEDRFFKGANDSRLGPLHHKLDLQDQRKLQLCDQWLGLEVGLFWDRPTMVWAFPISTVSQSESGFEAVQQSVAVIPHWEIEADARGRWSTIMRLKLDAARAAAPAKPTPALSSAGMTSSAGGTSASSVEPR